MSLTSRASSSRASTSLSARQEVDVGDELDEVGGARVLGGGLGEVVAGAVAQVLGLADVEDAALRVLHQVDAGRGRELLDLLAGGTGGEFVVGSGVDMARAPNANSRRLAFRRETLSS